MPKVPTRACRMGCRITAMVTDVGAIGDSVTKVSVGDNVSLTFNS